MNNKYIQTYKQLGARCVYGDKKPVERYYFTNPPIIFNSIGVNLLSVRTKAAGFERLINNLIYGFKIYKRKLNEY